MSFRPQYLETPPTLTDGQYNSGLVDALGNLLVNSTAIGTPADEAWDGVAAEATVISLLKKIALNTEPA
jgi:hypothetical protein